MVDLRENVRAIVEAAAVHNMPVEQATANIMAVVADALDEIVDIEELSELHAKIAPPERPDGPQDHWMIGRR